MSQMISIASKPKILDNVAWRRDGEKEQIIVLSKEGLALPLILNPTAAKIFSLCNGKNSLEDMATELCAEFGLEDFKMVLKDVKYSVKDANTGTTTAVGAIVQDGSAKSKDYGIFDLEFSTSGTYDNFINFTKDMESNLRIVDISSIVFSSDLGGVVNNPKTNSPEVYKYNFKIKTYWLKN